MASVSAGVPKTRKLKMQNRSIKRSIPLLILFIPVIAYYICFHYLPMFGIVMAFQNYNIRDGFFGSSWVGFKYFNLIFNTPATLNVVKNTLLLGVSRFLISIPFPILMALMLNEVKGKNFKKTVQTAVYLPHFLSWVIVGGIVVNLFGQETGAVNNLVRYIWGEPYAFLYNEKAWLAIFYGSGIWKECGFSAIIYLAALTGVDPELYDAASIDGASKLQRIWNVTLPCIMPTIVINLILQIGNSVNVGFDQIYVLTNPTVNNIADVVSTYVYRVGLQQMQFSLTSAMGLFQSLLGITLVVLTNRIAKKAGMNLW